MLSPLSAYFTKTLKILPLLMAVFISNAALAADSTYRTEYKISIFGLTIAKSAMDTRITDNNYSLQGTFSSSGIARIFDKTRGSITIDGSMQQNSVLPVNYNTAYQSGKKHKQTTISFKNGTVSAYENNPPVKKQDPWVELKADDLKAVFDPISAMMITATTANTVCQRVLQIFDGQTRAQIRLTPRSRDRLSVKGFDGEAIVCDAKFIPVSGYKQDKKSVRYLADKSKITISFASLQTDAKGGGIYAPVAASVGTQIGTVTIRASRFEKTSP